MSNSGGPRRRRVPERTVSGRPSGSLHRMVWWNPVGPRNAATSSQPFRGPLVRRSSRGGSARPFDGSVASPSAGCFDGPIGARKPHAVNRRARLVGMVACKVAEGNLVRLEKDILRNRSSHRDTDPSCGGLRQFGSVLVPSAEAAAASTRLRQSSSRFMEEACARHPTMRMAMAPTPFASFMAVARTPQARCLPDSGAT